MHYTWADACETSVGAYMTSAAEEVVGAAAGVDVPYDSTGELVP